MTVSTLLLTHPSFEEHDTGSGHPESADRIRAISTRLDAPEFTPLIRKIAPRAAESTIRLIHPQSHVNLILAGIPITGYHNVDGDTILSPASGEAAFCAVGAVCEAVNVVMNDKALNAFCAVRPPGHHAEPERAMGFCIFNNIAIAAEYARKNFGIQRVAIVDFDVHHGNGTQAAFYQQSNVLYASTHQSPLYPGTGGADETGVGNIFNVPLAARSGSTEFQQAVIEKVFPALHQFKPELLLISAGFDAHQDDPLASLNLIEDDYAWITRELSHIASRYGHGRIVSVLEGGYNLDALAESVASHVRELMNCS